MALTDIRVRNAKPKGTSYKLADGGGMYLLVVPNGSRYWRMDFRHVGKRRTIAIGVYPAVTLAVARARREAARAQIANGVDPSAAKRAETRSAKLARENTFEALAIEWLGNQRNGLSSKYAVQVLARMQADLFPYIGTRPIAEIDAPELLDVLRKTEKRGALETARRLRQICGQVFRYPVRPIRCSFSIATAAVPSFTAGAGTLKNSRPQWNSARIAVGGEF
jgi:Arm DNA-binding domain